MFGFNKRILSDYHAYAVQTKPAYIIIKDNVVFNIQKYAYIV